MYPTQKIYLLEDSTTNDLLQKFRFMKLAAKNQDFMELGFITQHVADELNKLDTPQIIHQINTLLHSIDNRSKSIFNDVIKFISQVLDFFGLNEKNWDVTIF